MMTRASGDDTDDREIDAWQPRADDPLSFLDEPIERFVAPLLASLAASTDEEFAPGELISHYEILHRVSAGGMGVVYKARDARLGRLVALKVLPPLDSDARGRTRLLSEARTLSALDHPNLGVVHEIGEAPSGRSFIVMTWHDGESVSALLGRGALSITHALALGRQVAAALAAAHASGVIHRDVKPSNVMITRDGTAKLVDFGIAVVSGATPKREETVAGTLAYMSPEQLDGGVIDFRSDLWSFGVLLYEMLTARRPFSEADPAACIAAIRRGEPAALRELRPDVPGALAELVMSCLSKDASCRPSSAADVLRALDAIDATLPRAASAGLRRSAVRSSRSRAALWSALTVGVLLAFGALWRSTRPVAAAADPKIPVRVVVLPFENRTGRPELDHLGPLAAEAIMHGLATTRLAEVVPAPPAFAANSPSQPGFRTVVTRAVSATGADLIVAGSFDAAGDSLVMRAMVATAARARVMHATPAVTLPEAGPLPAIMMLRDDVVRGIAPALFPLRGYGEVIRHVPSFEAYGAFMRGMQHFLERQWRDAVLQFSEAAALDSTFTLPLIQAGAALSLLGDYAALDSLLDVIHPRAHRLDEVERLGYEILQARVRGDLQTFYLLSRRGTELAHGTALPWRIANAPGWVNRPRELIEHIHRLDHERGPLRSWRLYWRDLMWAHHSLGEHRKELQVARRARQQFPTDTLYLYLEVRALAAMRRTRELAALIAAAEDGPASAALLMRTAGLELRLHGAPREGAELLRRSVEWQLARPARNPRARLDLAEGLALAGRLNEADTLLASLEEHLPESMELKRLRASVAARLGRRAAAESIATWFERRDGRYLHGANTYARAKIAAQLGDSALAVRLVRQAFVEGNIVWWTIHLDPDLFVLRGYAPFDEFVRPRG